MVQHKLIFLLDFSDENGFLVVPNLLHFGYPNIDIAIGGGAIVYVAHEHLVRSQLALLFLVRCLV